MAATCIARSRASVLKSGVRATKSVSQLTSTMRADPAAGVDVALDEPLLGRAVRLLLRDAEAALAQDLDGLLLVAAGFDERALAVHDAGAGHLSSAL